MNDIADMAERMAQSRSFFASLGKIGHHGRLTRKARLPQMLQAIPF